MKSYFFKYSDIGEIVQLSFPVSKAFRKKGYRLEANLDERFGSGEMLEIIPTSIWFSLECFKILMDIDLSSSGYSDFDSVAKSIRKRNDSRYEVHFLTDRTCDLYKKRLSEMIFFMENPDNAWFIPSADFRAFSLFVSDKMDRMNSETACILITPA